MSQTSPETVRLTLRGSGIACAGGVGQEAVTEALESRRTLYAGHPQFFDSAFDHLLCAFAPHEHLPDFAQRLAALADSALGDLFAQGRPAGSFTLHLLLPEPDHLTGLSAEQSSAATDHLIAHCRDRLTQAGLSAQIAPPNTDGRAGFARLLAAIAEGAPGDHLVLCVDSYCTASRLTAALHADLLFSARAPWGFVPGEAAVALWLTHDLRVPGRGLIDAAACGFENVNERDGGITDHAALSEAVRAASTGLGEEKIARWYTDLNNSRYRAAEFSYAVHRAQSFWLEDDLAALHLADIFGDCGVASGALALWHGCCLAPGPVSLWTGGAHQGLRGAVRFTPASSA